MVAFHDQLKKAMQQKGISQIELCKRTGITKSAMSQYISGKFKPKQQRTHLLAKALNVSEAWLMGLDGAEMERHDSIKEESFSLTDHEKQVVLAYRQQSSMQEAVDKLLGLSESEENKKLA